MSIRKPRPKVSYDKSLNKSARNLRNNSTPAEKRFWKVLRQMHFYQEMVFNRQKPIGKYIVDFYCHEQQLVIEIDGDTHYHDSAQIHDRSRTGYFQSQGLRVVRFTNRDVMENIDGVMALLEQEIQKQNLKSP